MEGTTLKPNTGTQVVDHSDLCGIQMGYNFLDPEIDLIASVKQIQDILNSLLRRG